MKKKNIILFLSCFFLETMIFAKPDYARIVSDHLTLHRQDELKKVVIDACKNAAKRFVENYFSDSLQEGAQQHAESIAESVLHDHVVNLGKDSVDLEQLISFLKEENASLSAERNSSSAPEKKASDDLLKKMKRALEDGRKNGKQIFWDAEVDLIKLKKSLVTALKTYDEKIFQLVDFSFSLQDLEYALASYEKKDSLEEKKKALGALKFFSREISALDKNKNKLYEIDQELQASYEDAADKKQKAEDLLQVLQNNDMYKTLRNVEYFSESLPFLKGILAAMAAYIAYKPIKVCIQKGSFFIWNYFKRSSYEKLNKSIEELKMLEKDLAAQTEKIKTLEKNKAASKEIADACAQLKEMATNYSGLEQYIQDCDTDHLWYAQTEDFLKEGLEEAFGESALVWFKRLVKVSLYSLVGVGGYMCYCAYPESLGARKFRQIQEYSFAKLSDFLRTIITSSAHDAGYVSSGEEGYCLSSEGREKLKRFKEEKKELQVLIGKAKVQLEDVAEKRKKLKEYQRELESDAEDLRRKIEGAVIDARNEHLTCSKVSEIDTLLAKIKTMQTLAKEGNKIATMEGRKTAAQSLAQHSLHKKPIGAFFNALGMGS